MLTLLLMAMVSGVDEDVLAEAADLPPIERAAFEKKVKALPKAKRLKLNPDELIAIARMKRALLGSNRIQMLNQLQERLGVDEEAAIAWLKKHPTERKALEKQFALGADQKEQLKDEEERVLLEKNRAIDDERRAALTTLLAGFRAKATDAGTP